MPRDSHKRNLLFEPLPQILFWDTNFILNLIYESSTNKYTHRAALHFIERLHKSDVNIYFSALLFPEYWHGILKTELCNKYNTNNVQKALEYFRNNPSIMKEIFPVIVKRKNDLNDLMAKFGKRIHVVETEIEITRASFKAMEKYNLESYDAIHIGTMLKGNFKNFVTFDGHIIRNCTDLNIWCLGANHNDISKYESQLKV